MATEQKRNDDLVRLVNESGETQRGLYDGATYEIETNGEIVVRRDIAEHLIRKTSALSATGRTYRLKIVELPVSQRQKAPGEFPKLNNEVTRLNQENEGLKEEIKKLVERINALDTENKKLRKK